MRPLRNPGPKPRVPKRWHALTRAEAEAYLEAFLREQDDRRAELRDAMRQSDGDVEDLDGSPESLVPLWAWARRRVSFHPAFDPDAVPPPDLGEEDLPPLDELPSWVGGGVADAARFTPDTLWLIDTVTREFAAVLRSMHPEAQWRVGHHRRAGYIEQNRPVLRWGNGDLNPLALVTVAVSRQLKGLDDDDCRLYELADHWYERLGEA